MTYSSQIVVKTAKIKQRSLKTEERQGGKPSALPEVRNRNARRARTVPRFAETAITPT